jgi:hypothetical protein
MPPYRGYRWISKAWGIKHMRKALLAVAVLVAASFSISTDAVAQAKQDPALAAQQNTARLMQDAVKTWAAPNELGASAKPAAKKGGKKKKK